MKSKDLSIGFVALIFAFLIGAGFLYLIYKTYSLFGFWTLTWTGFVQLISLIILYNLFGSRKESSGKITYNPKEFPKFIHMFINFLVGYYLYTIISVTNISQYDYYFGLSYLILLTGLPTLWSIYILFRDRNDFVEIDGNFISYKDNDKTERFEISNIKKSEAVIDLVLTFNDNTNRTIYLSKMNFNAKDKISLNEDINSRLTKVNEAN